MTKKNVNNINIINIFNETFYRYLPKKTVKFIITNIFEDFRINNYTLNLIYCNNELIKKINSEYLKHDYETDVISFEIDREPYIFEIYIGVEVAKMQAIEYKVNLRNEILRLTIHGALHLVGYDDKNEESRNKMKELEDFYLERIQR